MYTVTKDGNRMTLRNEIQLAAFLNSGWSVADETNAPSAAEMPKYTKTEVNRMSTAELKKLASEFGIADGTGAKLKEEIIKALGL